ISKIPLRTVFMNKKRSFSTVVAVATSMIILIASGSLFYDILYTMDQNYNQYEKYDVSVILRQPTSEKKIKTWIQQNVTGITTLEGYIYTEVFISDSNIEPQRVPLKAFHRNSTLREYHVISGKGSLETLSKDQVLMGSLLAKNLGINVGDQLKILFDQNNTFNVIIAGITGELFDDAVLWNIEAIQELTDRIQGINVAQNVNAFVFNYADGLSDERKHEIKRQVESYFESYAYSEVDETFETMKTLIEMVTGLLVLIALLGLGILVIFSFSSMSLAMMDREMEFLALRAMGAKRRTILKTIFLENVLYGLFGLIIGIPLSLALLRPSYDYLIENMYVPVIVPWILWLVVLITITFCVFLATSLLAWKTWRSSLPDMLRNRMVS
ncbi:MAG: ABC transporter permease, partial [Candidatus Hodarchaeota archaeon]